MRSYRTILAWILIIIISSLCLGGTPTEIPETKVAPETTPPITSQTTTTPAPTTTAPPTTPASTTAPPTTVGITPPKSETPSEKEEVISNRLTVPERWKEGAFKSEHTLYLPEGFRISVFASGLEGARFMAIDSRGDLYLSQTGEGKITVLPDRDEDGIADEAITFAKGLNLPHGLAFYNEYLYVAETDGVVRLKDEDKDLEAEEIDEIITGIPSGSGHFTRTIGFGPDDNIYLSVGSSCNICEDDPRRAAILQFNKDGKDEKIYASGLRNSVGFVWHPNTKEMWATDNGRDWLGDDLPPDEINIVKEERHYGWPYCYGKKIPDPEYKREDFCRTTEPSKVDLQAHSAPLGLRYYTGDQFPEEYKNNLFVAYHGSWNRKIPTGYKIVRIRFKDDEPIIEDFATGWLVEEKKWGRPVDVIVAPDGGLFVSDDYAGAVYKITYEGLQD
ncbi:MAG: PQQ-dependent sugar dehydrogenase [Candidatus Hydrothermarchaeales archaeon]